MSPDPQDRVDIPGLSPTGPSPAPSEQIGPRAWLGIYFRCCHTYGRLYRDRAGKRYTGSCPRCGVALSVPIGPAGTNQRFFEAI